MYNIYETEAFILKRENLGETDQKILALTKDFGFIWINISGNRKETSKHRFFSQNFSYSKLFLVKGKNGFRLTGGNLIENIFFDLNSKEKFSKWLNFLNLVEKIEIYNHKDIKVFNLILNFYQELKEENEKINQIEIKFLKKLLYHHGYSDNQEMENYQEEIKKINQILRKIF